VTTQYDEVSRDGHPSHLMLPAGWPLNATSPVLSKSMVAKTGIGKLFGFTATSTNVAAQFILLFDALALPANGTVPVAAYNVAAANSVPVYYGPPGRAFSRGIVLANSTTQGTLTLGAADTIFDVQYV
jgi:hypothetical protein